jgi:hypothetical protein
MHKQRRKQTECLNCHTLLFNDFEFCPKCGQENTHYNIPVKHIAFEFIESFTHFDTKLWNVIKAIFTSPGKMTKDFIEGKRARYVPPARLYVFISVIFFFTLSKLADKGIDKNTIRFTNNEEVSWQYLINNKEKYTNIIANLKPNINIDDFKEILRCSFKLPTDTLSQKTFLTTIKNTPVDSIIKDNDIDTSASNKLLIKQLLASIDVSPQNKTNIFDSISFNINSISLKAKNKDAMINKLNEISHYDNSELDSVFKVHGSSGSFFNRVGLKNASLLYRITLNDFDAKHELNSKFIKAISFIMFLLMPFAALLLFIFGRKWYFYEHLIFSIHIHTILFLFTLMQMGLYLLFKNAPGYIFVFYWGAVFIYFLMSLSKVYNKSFLGSFWRVCIMFLPYIIVFSIFVMFGMLVGFIA